MSGRFFVSRFREENPGSDRKTRSLREARRRETGITHGKGLRGETGMIPAIAPRVLKHFESPSLRNTRRKVVILSQPFCDGNMPDLPGFVPNKKVTAQPTFDVNVARTPAAARGKTSFGSALGVGFYPPYLHATV